MIVGTIDADRGLSHGQFNLKKRSVHKLLIASIAAASLTLPQIAAAQSSPPAQNQQSMQSRVKNDLEQAGFTNIQVMPSSFLVKVTDKDS